MALGTNLLNSADPYFGLPIWLFGIIVIWIFIWKGFAMWKAAKKNSPIWFVVLLVVNTVGLLEILYIFLFSKMKVSGASKSKLKRKR